MFADADDDVEISATASTEPCVSFAGDANALTVAGSSLDANLKRVGTSDAAFTVADAAGGNILARSVTAWAGDVEFHPAAGLLDRSVAMALRALAGGLHETIAVTVAANIAPGDVQFNNGAATRRPEGYVDLILEVTAGLGTGVSRFSAATAGK